MKKSEVLEMFDGQKGAAFALDITDSAVRIWPDELGPYQVGRVIVASIRWKGVRATKRRWPEYFERATL